ncbi:MAG: hypothetical protein ACI8UO_001327 [Verrucomicrobiales bacterium]|jgi:hypothetical protein
MTIRFYFLLISAALIFGAPAVAEAVTGLEIMEERERRHETDQEETWDKMHLYDRKGDKKEERLMVTFSIRLESGNRSLIKFASPADIRSVGLLTWEQPEDKEDDQWLFLPATKLVKRIAGGGKKNQFMGTDLAYEDLRRENLAAHDYKLTGETTIDDHGCWIVEATPITEKEKKDSGYGKRVFYIRKDIYYTVKTEFYDKRDRKVKIGIVQKIVNVGGNAYRSNIVAVQRVREGTKTITVNERRELDEELDESLFTQEGLKRPLAAAD